MGSVFDNIGLKYVILLIFQPFITKNKLKIAFFTTFSAVFYRKMEESSIFAVENYSNMETIQIIIAGIVVIVAMSVLAGRWVYERNMRIKSQLQMGQMLANITQELLGPLTILTNSLERLRNAHPEERRELELMDLNIKRSVKLLQHITETGNQQDRELKLLVSNGDVMQYIKETATTLEPLMNNKHQLFHISCHPESMMGWIDTDKLDKIIFGLLLNAVNNTERGGHVSLNVTTSDHFDQIFIHDTNAGTDATQLSQIRKLVNLNRGKITYDASEGTAGTCTIMLPIHREAFKNSQIDENNQIVFDIPLAAFNDSAPSGNIADEIAPTTDKNAPRLLLVENNNTLRTLISQFLQNKYHVITASNGVEARNIIQNTRLDIVLAKANLPVLDGYTLTKDIKQDRVTGHLPVILVVHRTREDEQRQALVSGADDIITMPTSFENIILHVDNVLANRQRLQAQHVMLDYANADAEVLGNNMSPMENAFLEKAVNCVKKNINDSDYDRDAFAADMGSSSSSLYNKIRHLTGMNITEFVRDIRIKTACRLAKDHPDMRVSDIAYQVGFKDPKYFATSFKRVTGMQPKEYFDRVRNEGRASVSADSQALSQ